jgi:hypothetical protein
VNFISCEFCHVLLLIFVIVTRRFFPTGKPPKVTDFEEYACARQETESIAQKDVASYYTYVCLLHITLDTWCRVRDPKTHTNLMQSKQVTTAPHLLVLTEPNNMTSNYFNSHTIKFTRYKIVTGMANVRERCRALRSSERVYKKLRDQCRAPRANVHEISSVHLKRIRETASPMRTAQCISRQWKILSVLKRLVSYTWTHRENSRINV